MNLGNFELCLNVRDIGKSSAFYKRLDFVEIGGTMADGRVALQHGDCKLTIYQCHLGQSQLNFRGGDVFSIASMLKERGVTMKSDASQESDESEGALVEDLDWNVIYFNTSPNERAI